MDVRNFLIGFLTAAVVFLFIGSTQDISSEVKTRNLTIVNQDGKTVAQISSDSSGGALVIYDNNGVIRIYSASTGDGGVLSIANNKGDYVESIGVDVNRDGVFTLMDRYGDVGLHLTGKK